MVARAGAVRDLAEEPVRPILPGLWVVRRSGQGLVLEVRRPGGLVRRVVLAASETGAALDREEA